VRVEAPIYVEESILDKAGMILDKETGKPISEEEGEEVEGKKVSEEEIRRMSAFRDFINTLDLDDLDKHQS
jgi:bifunctional DNase/RNase